MNQFNQINVVCLDKYAQKTSCKYACRLTFPDTPKLREIFRPALTEIIAACPKKEWLRGDPHFGDPTKPKKEIKP